MRFSNQNDKKVKHKEFIKLYAQKMNCSEKNAEKYLDGFIETIYDIIKEKSSITVNNFGKFYVSQRKDSTAFKFNPSQKMKAVLGWSSNYKGKT
jgi:DNA-binding protein HU-beta